MLHLRLITPRLFRALDAELRGDFCNGRTLFLDRSFELGSFSRAQDLSAHSELVSHQFVGNRLNVARDAGAGRRSWCVDRTVPRDRRSEELDIRIFGR
jgi:hypothetical protein